MNKQGNQLEIGMVYGIAILAVILFSMGWIPSVLQTICLQETKAVYALAGIALKENPSLELQVIKAVKEGGTAGDEQQEALIQIGQQVLGRYGYEPEVLMQSRSLYSNIRKLLYGGFVGMAAASTGTVIWLIWHNGRFNRRWQQQIIHIINQLREGNYAFADQAGSIMEEAGRTAGSSLVKLSDQLKLLGNQIRYQKQCLIEEQESTKELVTDISHQLKTPLAALYTCFELYQEAESEEERQEFGWRVEFQIHKLQRLIAGLVQISRMEHAMIVLHTEPVNIQEILQSALDSVSEKARKRGIVIQAESKENELLLLDQKWTEEAVVNVLDNAIKYSPGGSMIQMTAMPYVSFWRIEIADQGIGIPKEEYTKVFQRFYRSNDRRVKESEGAGVGLFLTRMILERQGGSIFLRERTGGGSIFVIQLPR